MNGRERNTTADEPVRAQLPCPECRIGRLTAGQASLITDIEGNIITLPDFPAWICDVCGYRSYDRAALSRLQSLLSTEAHRRKSATHVQPSAEREQPSTGPEPPRRV